MGIAHSTWVIARRDFMATVYSRSFILFMLTPILVIGAAILMSIVGARSAGDDTPVVAVVADRETTQALNDARGHLSSLVSERRFPMLRVIDPAEDVQAQARTLAADEDQGLSAVFTGTLDRPLLTGPPQMETFIAKRMTLIIEQAQRDRALRAGATDFTPAPVQRDVTPAAAGSTRELQSMVARIGQTAIFFFTLLLATMLLSNLIEEKSNKVIEILAASVPLDAIFLGKLLAMLAVSLVGIALWAGMFGLAVAFSVQLLPEGLQLPAIEPAVGWPLYALLLPIYYTTNYMLLGSLFLGIGGQANSVREVQTLNMPVTFLQMGVFFLAVMVIGHKGGIVPMIAYIFPFSSPLAMIAEAGQSSEIWPHLLAIPWQALWVFLLIRISAAFFRRTVLKSGGEVRIMPRLSFLGGKRG